MSDYEKLKNTFDEIGIKYCESIENCNFTKLNLFKYIEVGSYSGIDLLSYKFNPSGDFISIS